MNQPTRPDLKPTERTTTTITVAGAALDHPTVQRLRDLGGGAIYTLNVILPPSEVLAGALGP